MEQYGTVLRRYEDFLLGKAPYIIKGMYSPDKMLIENDGEMSEETKNKLKEQIDDAKEKDALMIIRYAISELLEWTPQDAMDSMNEGIMKQLKLDKIIEYVRYPRDLSKKKDFDWMVHLAFPNETQYDIGEHVLKVYQRVKCGDLKRFPKKMFEGDNSAVKLAILLNDFISKNLAAKTISDLYDVFGDNTNSNVLMHDAKLYYAYRELYDTPLEYLHESLGSSRDEFLFSYYQYMSAYKSIEKDVH